MAGTARGCPGHSLLMASVRAIDNIVMCSFHQNQNEVTQRSSLCVVPYTERNKAISIASFSCFSWLPSFLTVGQSQYDGSFFFFLMISPECIFQVSKKFDLILEVMRCPFYFLLVAQKQPKFNIEGATQDHEYLGSVVC